MYCRTLDECLRSVVSVGLRAGGGLGEAIEQPLMRDLDNWTTRYYYDLLFFLSVNILLVNIVFGIIIDSFADRRAADYENRTEE